MSPARGRATPRLAPATSGRPMHSAAKPATVASSQKSVRATATLASLIARTAGSIRLLRLSMLKKNGRSSVGATML